MATLSRRTNDLLQERVVIPCDHPEVTGDTTIKFFNASRDFRVTRAYYINPTGLAEDTTNVFAGSVKNGSTVVATLFNTDSDLAGADNSLAADTLVEGVLSATDANRILAAGDWLSLLLDEGGAATLPAGRLVVEGFYL